MLLWWFPSSWVSAARSGDWWPRPPPYPWGLGAVGAQWRLWNRVRAATAPCPPTAGCSGSGRGAYTEAPRVSPVPPENGGRVFVYAFPAIRTPRPANRASEVPSLYLGDARLPRRGALLRLFLRVWKLTVL